MTGIPGKAGPPDGGLPHQNIPDSPEANPETPENTEISTIGFLTGAVGVLLLIVSFIGILNTAFGWELALSVYGSETELPRHWDAALGLFFVSLIWNGIWALLTWVPPIQRFGRKHPWIMTGIVLGSITLAIVIITVIDNRNIAERERQWQLEEQQIQDSIDALDLEDGPDGAEIEDEELAGEEEIESRDEGEGSDEDHGAVRGALH